MEASRQRVGIVGFGKLGQYLSRAILERGEELGLELVFVWNRSVERIRESELRIPEELICSSLDDVGSFRPDLIVEVAHPKITEDYGARFLEIADYMVGSPTVFANAEVEHAVREAARGSHAAFIPSGALWGAQDIQKMAELGTLRGLTITMKKHPSSLKVVEELQPALREAETCEPAGEVVVFAGPVRGVCSLAPNNVNTMAAAAMAAKNLGFDTVQARLVADRTLESHIIEIDVVGPAPEGADPSRPFRVQTMRYNPAAPGAVTGSATFGSFLSSLVRCRGMRGGVHLV